MVLEAPAWSAEPLTRLFVGVSVGSRSGRLKTALLRCRGEGWSLRCARVDAATLPPPPSGTAAMAKAICDAVLSLANRSGVPMAALDCLGLGSLPADDAPGQVAAHVAERMGTTVVSGFEYRDKACGGRGGPLSPLPDWFLYRSPKLSRLLIHLGRSLQITLVTGSAVPKQLLCFDVGPCCDFLDLLAAELSQGRLPFDPSGHFAVQGRVSPELISKWLSHPFLLRPPPKSLVGDEFGRDLVEASLTFAREKHLTARDVLCSANHFVAQNLLEAIRRFLPPARRIDEVWASGGGSWNGFLWKLLQDRLDPAPVLRTDDSGIPSEARSAIHVALLSYLTMENLAGNVPMISGARFDRVLGQITPGSPENWDRWVCNLADRFDLAHDQAA